MNIKQYIKLAVFTAAKWSGMFSVSRFLMRHRLMILGYHGFQNIDEACFRPILFMEQDTFSRRIDIIARGNYSVLPLAEGVHRLTQGSLPANAIVITIDDGFFSTLNLAAPILKKYGFPSTLYVTSYYVIKGTPIFRLVIQYLFWKTKCATFSPLDYPWSPSDIIDLYDPQQVHSTMWQIINYGEEYCDEDERQKISTEVAAALNINYDTIRTGRLFSLLTQDELLKLKDFGIDVQLHTHRHSFPTNNLNQANSELNDNRMLLESVLGHRLEHFCYPSGVWSLDTVSLLEDQGIRSATTCQAGMNDKTTNNLALYRFLDQNDLHDIEFEAELSGFCELIRIVSGRRYRTNKNHSIRT